MGRRLTSMILTYLADTTALGYSIKCTVDAFEELEHLLGFSSGGPGCKTDDTGAVKEETESVNFRKSSSVSKENSIFMEEPAPLMMTPVFDQFKTVDSTRSLQDHFEKNDKLSLLNFNLN